MSDILQSTKRFDHLEQLLKTEQDKFKAIFYGADTPMVVFKGPQLIIETFNDKYQAIYPNREILGKPLLEAVPELKDSPFPNILKNVYEKKEHSFSKEGLARILNVKTNLLEDRYFDTTFSYISYGDDEPFRIVGTPREVTERVLARIQLESNLSALEQEKGLRETLISSLSHDLRTPLSIAKMCAQLIKYKEENSEENIDMADKISSSLDRADRLIRDLLDTSRLKAGLGIPLTIDRCCLKSIMQTSLDDLKNVYGDRFIFMSDIDEASGFWDEMAIYRIVENLVINGVKYGLAQTPIILNLTQEKNDVCFSVTNTGQTITEEEKAVIFNLFAQSKDSSKVNQLGWGIGLSVVKGLIEAHGGSIGVECSEDNKTSFFVKVPKDARKFYQNK